MMARLLLQRLNDLLLPLLLTCLLVLGLWLSQLVPLQWDWTRHASHSLSEVSIRVLERMPGPLKINVFVPQAPDLHDQINRFLERYRKHKPDLQVNFIDPTRHPDEARRQSISPSGELLLFYQDREERIQRLDEQRLTQAMQRLLQTHTRWIAGLS